MNAQTADLASPALEARTLHGVDEFMRLERDWRRLVATTRSRNPFLTWEWVSTWLRHFCAETLVTVVVTEGEQVVGIAPFHRRRYQLMPGVAATALQLLAPREISHLFEIREVLTTDGRRAEVLQAMLNELGTIRDWDWLEFSAYGPDVPLWEQMLASLGPSSTSEVEVETRVPVMTLMDSWEGQRGLLKRNVKESIRHCYNSLKREGHSHAVSGASTPAERDRAIRSLFELHRLRSLVNDRFPHRDHFRQAEVREFLAEAFEALALSNCAALYSLTIDEEVVAVRATMEINGSLYLYHSGFEPRWWSKGVATLLLTEMVKAAIERRLAAVNFSPGMDNSKTRWGVETERLISFAIVRSRPASRLARRATLLRKTLRKRTWRLLRSLTAEGRRRQALEARMLQSEQQVPGGRVRVSENETL